MSINGKIDGMRIELLCQMVLARSNILVEISIRWSNLGFEVFSRGDWEKSASHTRNKDGNGNVWVNIGISHRLFEN